MNADLRLMIYYIVFNVCAAYKQHCMVKQWLFYQRMMKKCQSESKKEPKLSEMHRNAKYPQTSAIDPQAYLNHYTALNVVLA